MTREKKGLHYKDVGVDRAAVSTLVDTIKRMSHTQDPAVLEGIGGFASLYELPASYRRPVLVTATDGVGTKRTLAIEMNKHGVLGVDLVAMCVNDLICCGAKPLLFLDYYAAGALQAAPTEELLAGIIDGCRQAGCILAGGETAEMPGLYADDDYDLAGFAVGIVEKNAIIKARAIDGSVLIGLTSSGAHANGYSMVRHLLAAGKINLEQPCGETTLAEELMQPTKIYVKEIRQLQEAQIPLQGVAHITGGGITENLPRSLPLDTMAMIDFGRQELPPLFQILQRAGDIDEEELHRLFNCGIGMIIIVAAEHAEQSLSLLTVADARIIGEVRKLEQTSDKGKEPPRVLYA